MWHEQVIAAHDLYCCLLPQCEALRTCRSGFPIATPHLELISSFAVDSRGKRSSMSNWQSYKKSISIVQ